MSKLNNIRKLYVIGDSGVGKTTLIDALVSKTKMVSNSSSMFFELDDQVLGELNIKFNCKDHDVFHIDLIDLPDGTDIPRDGDGALVFIDAVKGVSAQIEKLLSQALTERIQLALVINKVDRCILVEMLDAEELYQRFVSIITQCNALAAAYHNTDHYFNPKQGNVMFSSGKHGWAFALPQYARLLVLFWKTDALVNTCIQLLWGDSFYSAPRKKWLNSEQAKAEYGHGNVKRGFTTYVLESLYSVIHACDNQDINMIKKMSAHIYLHLPSPIQSQILKDTHLH